MTPEEIMKRGAISYPPTWATAHCEKCGCDFAVMKKTPVVVGKKGDEFVLPYDLRCDDLLPERSILTEDEIEWRTNCTVCGEEKALYIENPCAMQSLKRYI